MSRIGVSGEAHGLMRWLLDGGAVPVVAVHVLVARVAIVGFDRLVTLVRSLEEPRRTRFARWCERRWLGLVVTGALIVATNVLVPLGAVG